MKISTLIYVVSMGLLGFLLGAGGISVTEKPLLFFTILVVDIVGILSYHESKSE